MNRISRISIGFSLYFFLWGLAEVLAQCPMCKAGVESNARNSASPIGATLNTGILMLLSLPFLGVLVIGGIWYYKKRKLSASEAVQLLAD